MDFSKYDEFIAESKNNVLNNEFIVKGANVIYFDSNRVSVKIYKIDHEKKIVCFEDDNKFLWWDYFMDANWRVLDKN